MNTPGISTYVEHHSLWGKDNKTEKSEKAFMKSAIKQWSTITTSDQISNIYSTLGIVGRALYEVFEENGDEVGTWTRWFEQDQAVANKGRWTHQLTVQKKIKFLQHFQKKFTCCNMPGREVAEMNVIKS